MQPLRRHDRVYLRPGASFEFDCGQRDPVLAGRVAAWIATGRPLVAARQQQDGQGLLLGLTLPAAEGRRRIGCRVALDGVLRVERPLPVSVCLPRLDQRSAMVLEGLDAGLQVLGVKVGVYGSLAWEALSGEAYRHAESDVDLICDIDRAEALRPCLEHLRAAAAALTCGLDGEVRAADGTAVAWKELLVAQERGQGSVLCKGEAEVALLPLDAVLRRFDGEG